MNSEGREVILNPDERSKILERFLDLLKMMPKYHRIWSVDPSSVSVELYTDTRPNPDVDVPYSGWWADVVFTDSDETEAANGSPDLIDQCTYIEFADWRNSGTYDEAYDASPTFVARRVNPGEWAIENTVDDRPEVPMTSVDELLGGLGNS